MSLLLKSRVETINGFVIEEAYGRVAATDGFSGESIIANLDWFLSEAAFLNGSDPIYLKGVKDSINFPYNRDVESKDILDLAHDQYVSVYAADSLVVEKLLN